MTTLERCEAELTNRDFYWLIRSETTEYERLALEAAKAGLQGAARRWKARAEAGALFAQAVWEAGPELGGRDLPWCSADPLSAREAVRGEVR